MTKTASQIIARAHRRIRVLGTDDPVTAEMQSVGSEVLEGLFAQIQGDATITWDLTVVPDDVFLSLSDYLAAYLAGEYNRPAPVSRARAYADLMEQLRPDDRTDRRDTDEDGLISEDEAAAGDRALYY